MSLRARLLLAVGAVALVALSGADFAVYVALRTSLVGGVDTSLDSSRVSIERAIGAFPIGVGGPLRPDQPVPHGPNGATSGPPAGPQENGTAPVTNVAFCDRATALSAGAFVALVSANGQPTVGGQCLGRTPGGSTYRLAAGSRSNVMASATLGPAGTTRYFNVAGAAQSGELRVSTTQLPSGKVLIVALPLAATNRTLAHLLLIELLTTGAALALAVLLGWWLVRIGLWPLREVERTASAITAGDLALRVPGEDRHTEVGKVAVAINSMLGQIERAFAERDQTEAELRASENRLRQFVADASHELRTPIAAVAAYSELFSKGAAERHDDLEHVMAGIRGETARMGGLVHDLLLLARLDEGRPLDRRSVEVVAIVSEAIRTAETVDPRWPVTLTATEPIELDADPRQLRQVVDNLLANVRAHTPAGTCTTVRVQREGRCAAIEVQDDGPGISAEHAPHLFERFYRADPSRARVTGGAGLGLAIVFSIVAAHHGQVDVAPLDPHGARFRVLLPLSVHHDEERPSTAP